MKGIKKKFTTALLKNWKTTFPFLEAVPRPSFSPNTNDYFYVHLPMRTGVVCFFVIAFSPKRSGAFTLEVHLARDTDEKTLKTLPVAWECPSTFTPGYYRIARFKDQNIDYFWFLENPNALYDKLVSTDESDTFSILRRPRDNRSWFPATYDAPMPQIIDAAIADLNSQIEQYVLPVLKST
ncbi:MAG TPA: hypothetical protein VEK08_26685 [Planctomycetota bacterium]|nr:hypothetical protein [Planctomycetota bacterium]